MYEGTRRGKSQHYSFYESSYNSPVGKVYNVRYK